MSQIGPRGEKICSEQTISDGITLNTIYFNIPITIIVFGPSKPATDIIVLYLHIKFNQMIGFSLLSNNVSTFSVHIARVPMWVKLRGGCAAQSRPTGTEGVIVLNFRWVLNMQRTPGGVFIFVWEAVMYVKVTVHLSPPPQSRSNGTAQPADVPTIIVHQTVPHNNRDKVGQNESQSSHCLTAPCDYRE